MADVIHATESFVLEKIKDKQDKLSDTQLSKIANALTDANEFDKAGDAAKVKADLLVEIGKLGHIEIRRVSARPETGESGVIYLVPSSKTVADNVYDEYLWIEGKWELIGSTAVDLSGYAKTSDIPSKTSDLENDSGFLTEHQDISGKRDKYDDAAYGLEFGVWELEGGSQDYYNITFCRTRHDIDSVGPEIIEEGPLPGWFGSLGGSVCFLGSTDENATRLDYNTFCGLIIATRTVDVKVVGSLAKKDDVDKKLDNANGTIRTRLEEEGSGGAVIELFGAADAGSNRIDVRGGATYGGEIRVGAGQRDIDDVYGVKISGGEPWNDVPASIKKDGKEVATEDQIPTGDDISSLAADACKVNPSTSLALKDRDCCLVAYTEGMTFTFAAKEEGQAGLRSFEVIVTGCTKDGAANWPAVTYRGDSTDLIPDDGDNHWTFAEQQDGSFAVTRHIANTFTIGE